MRVYRQPPFPLSVEVTGGNANTNYDVAVLNNHTEWGATVTSDALGTLNIELPNYPFAYYDETYALTIQTENALPFIWNDGRTDFVEDLEVYRPLWQVDPDDPEDVAKEALIRAVIDAITGGFYYTREYIEGQGLGTDFYPTPAYTRDVLEAWENNVHVFKKYIELDDQGEPEFVNYYPYQMTKDLTAITIGHNFERVSVASKPVRFHRGNSDSYETHHYRSPFFPDGFYYNFLLANGWVTIPDDIKLVAELLKKQYEDEGTIGGSEMDDYITEYSTDQFKLVMDSRAGENKGFGSTGNKAIDVILQKYINKATHIDRLGVL